MAKLLDHRGVALPEGAGTRARMMANMGDSRTAYRAGNPFDQDMATFRPSLRSADADWFHERELSMARIRHLARNSASLAAGLQRKVDLLVGSGWRLQARVDFRRLGITEEDGQKLSADLEMAWADWASDPLNRGDSREMQKWDGQLALAVRDQQVSGEFLAVLGLKETEGFNFVTRLQLVDPDRLSNPNGGPDSEFQRGGVEYDEHGCPVAYHIQEAHPGDWTMSAKGSRWERYARREAWGRPKTIHAFRPDRIDQSRGVSRMVSLVSKALGLDRVKDYELANVAVNALVAGVIYSQFDPETMRAVLSDDEEALGKMQDDRLAFYKDADLRLGSVRIPQLYLGDKFELNSSPRATSAIDTFCAVYEHELAGGLGMSRAQFKMDFSGHNYAVIRGELVESWRGIEAERNFIASEFVGPARLAVVEDIFDSGMIRLPRNWPEFWDAPRAYLQADWIGPGRGWVDPVKEFQAALGRIEAGLSTWEKETADQGGDFDANLAQLKRERDKWKASGLTPPALQTMLAVQAPTDREDRQDT